MKKRTPQRQTLKVMKCGGSSVASPERVRAVTDVVLQAAANQRVLVVVSAFQGVTNSLLQCAQVAQQGGSAYEALYQKIATRHRDAASSLLKGDQRKKTLSAVDALLRELYDVLHGISLLGDCPPRALDLTASFGERCSAMITGAYMNQRH